VTGARGGEDAEPTAGRQFYVYEDAFVMSTVSGVSLADRVFGIDGKVSLITGGYSGIGAAVSLGLAEMGAKIAVAGIEGDQAAAFAGRLRSRGHDAYSDAFDVVSAAATQRMVDAVVERFGRLDILVNSVGVNLEQRAEEVTEEAFERTVAVNLKGAMFQAQSAARQMIRQGTGGKHVHIGSVRSQLALRGRGYAAYCATKGGLGTLCKQLAAWDRWYEFLTETHGMSKKAAFIGMSKGGVNGFNWGVANPEKVACIYADNPALYDEDFAKLPELAKHDVPLLHICGTEDMLLQRHTLVIEDIDHRLGGSITVIVKEGDAHHPHSLQNAKPIADWIEQHMQPSTANRPAFADQNFTKSYYYSLDPSFIYLKEEQTYATARGPGFTESYDRYDANRSSTFRSGGMAIIVPRTVAPGKPWVFRADAIDRSATVDQALLAKGFHIVTPPLTEQSGTVQQQWDDTYTTLVDNGFSRKPVMEGTGADAGEMYAWAIANPDKVSCIYARNPSLRSLMTKSPPIDNLASLAKAGIPILHDCGSLDPWLNEQTRVVEKRHKELGGPFTLIVREGEGHFPLAPKDPKAVVDFIMSHQR
jgi:NADP-dependent 3-hydroxy acid dehydrogenase YdfG/pimeloyl-ACP methyl ester carboxylesterase